MGLVHTPGELVGHHIDSIEVVALLAEGGSSEIYLAKTLGEEGFVRPVVLKRLLPCFASDPEMEKMFLDEARLAAQLEHTHIVKTTSLGRYQDQYYLEMEYLPGLCLTRIFQHQRERNTTTPWQVVLGFASQICEGLEYAHNRTQANGQPLKLVHRDVSPQNLIVSYTGVVKIVDFGIAKAEARETNTEAGTIKGKFAYMSPEQVVAGPLDSRSDLFSLGIVLHELLTGKKLFKRISSQDTFHLIVNGVVPLPSSVIDGIPPEVDRLIKKCLAVNPDDRFQTATSLNAEVLNILHSVDAKRGTDITRSFMESEFLEEREHSQETIRQLIAGEQTATVASLWRGSEDDNFDDDLAPPPQPDPPKQDGSTSKTYKVPHRHLATTENLHAATPTPNILPPSLNAIATSEPPLSHLHCSIASKTTNSEIGVEGTAPSCPSVPSGEENGVTAGLISSNLRSRPGFVLILLFALAGILLGGLGALWH